MKIACIWEHNGQDTLLYARDFPGVYGRGENLEEAKEKVLQDLQSYCCWLALPVPEKPSVEIVTDIPSNLTIADADSDALLPGEEAPLTASEYAHLKAIALKSASDFLLLYQSIPDKTCIIAPRRRTFYGQVPCTAKEMYEHTKSVNAYYFGEIGIDADNEGSIWDCRNQGFAIIESTPNYLENTVFEGSYGESWSLRKVLRRFIWHDRIHGKAMYRRSIAVFGPDLISNPFCF